ncbi:MAG: type II secretion system protein GspK [Candidatus Omnitrophica bacterium]|nr:type II secretion system protein GspK [Candidatus Omnitrophota bacterium]
MDSPARGSVLILLLWVLLFVSTLAVASSLGTMQQVRAVEKIETRERIYELAASGALAAVDAVSSSTVQDMAPAVDTLNDLWADDAALFKNVLIGSAGSYTVSYDRTDDITGAAETKYGVIDEERKINVNYASKEVLVRLLFRTAGLSAAGAEETAGAIIDWRDADNIMGDGEQAITETAHYSATGHGYVPSNTPFRLPEELQLVKGMSAEIFAAIRDYITVFGKGRVNVNTAPKNVLVALGLPEELADKIIYFRAGLDSREGTPDDNTFFSSGTIDKDLSAQCSLTRQEKSALAAAISGGAFEVTSETFMAVSAGALKNRDLCGTLVCIFDRSGRIKYHGYYVSTLTQK